MFTGKAPGSDAIPSKIYKEGGPISVTQLTNPYKSMWRKEQLLKNSEMLRLSTSTSVKVIISLAIIIETFHFSL